MHPSALLLLRLVDVAQSGINELPKELRALVKRAVAILGEVIQYEAGQKTFQYIENTRKEMANLRCASQGEIYSTLDSTLKGFKRCSSKKRAFIAHSFTLMLELMNSCENAYRTYRLKQYPPRVFSKLPTAMIYVVTAHPTESRSSANITIFHEIQKTLTELLIQDTEENWLYLRNDLELAWKLSTTNTRRPRVRDEADHIYSIVLREETLNALLASRREFGPIYIRSWVGGDKDGHPGVNEKTLQMSLSNSRVRLLKFFKRYLNKLDGDLKLLRNYDPKLDHTFQTLKRTLSRLQSICPGDGRKIKTLHLEFGRLTQLYERLFGTPNPELSKLRLLLQMFPALVVPMELREHSELIHAGARGQATVIGRMLRQLASIARGGEPRFYARGLIISMANSFENIQAAAVLVRKHFGELKIPIIPLFEQERALNNAPGIMKQMLESSLFQRAIHQKWQGYLEVMLGYSDSAKELGVFASHLAIMNTVQKLDQLYRNYSITPVFFHGSGGSTDRGGGSIEEQTEWWPKSAFQIYKATIQGEMVERTFASFEITRRRFEQIVLQMNQLLSKGHRRLPSDPVQKAVQDFGFQVSQEYQKKVKSPHFFNVVYQATSYRYLSILRIGSRPAKRGKVLSISDLRAIPWVLCWTQTRVLFPTWWGVGTVWNEIRKSEESHKKMQVLRRAFRGTPVFRSYIKILSSTLERVELPIWRLYLENCGLPRDLATLALNDFQKEYQSAVDFVRALSGRRDLLWFRPWFGTSIRLRSPMIHPLNLLQIIAIQDTDHSLLRETVTGIASGMMTTG